SEHAKHRLVVRLVPRILEHLPVPDDAVLVEDEDGAAGDAPQAAHVLVEGTLVAAPMLAAVSPKWTGVSLMTAECRERKEGSDADAVRLRVRMVEPRQRVAERAELLRTHAAERRGKEREHDRLSSLIAELDRLPLLAGQREVRRFRSNVY